MNGFVATFADYQRDAVRYHKGKAARAALQALSGILITAEETARLLRETEESVDAGFFPLDALPQESFIVDEALAENKHLVWLRESLQTGPFRAGLLTSLGFGHVSAIILTDSTRTVGACATASTPSRRSRTCWTAASSACWP